MGQLASLNCLVCKKNSWKGIVVLEKQICPSCEQKIVKLDTSDHTYLEYVISLKQLWRDKPSI
ncbi:sigma factor G inhibitor Gin [Thermoflavimicrobium daqui]|uniref:Inhibitor of sigma-G Gin n=1 Tax=Thermoflavimicrobium daqui TaxID=2137476 RepID=A0A364K2V9_9BACL|nr:sigma factor G inhibitor Gin [Thermoflavimicrobium daqui]RAL23153.1 hypothetical protein DL897_12345 [Thermoflavimicrobium daqui]